MRNFADIYSHIAADSTTMCSPNSVIFTTAIDFEIKCRTGYAYQREDIALQHCGQFCKLPRIVKSAIIPRKYALRCVAA